MQTLPLIDLNILFGDFAQYERRGIVYGYGTKAPTEFNGSPIKLADVTPSILAQTKGAIDCSGFSKLGLCRSTRGALTIADGSQNQREQFEAWATQGIVRQITNHTLGNGTYNPSQMNYRDACLNITGTRLFIHFIKPGVHGCGDVGHVFLTALYDDGNNGTKCGTLESHGGGGCTSRAWNTPVLFREVYNTFELPTTQGAK